MSAEEDLLTAASEFAGNFTPMQNIIAHGGDSDHRRIGFVVHVGEVLETKLLLPIGRNGGTQRGKRQRAIEQAVALEQPAIGIAVGWLGEIDFPGHAAPPPGDRTAGAKERIKFRSVPTPRSRRR